MRDLVLERYRGGDRDPALQSRVRRQGKPAGHVVGGGAGSTPTQPLICRNRPLRRPHRTSRRPRPTIRPTPAHEDDGVEQQKRADGEAEGTPVGSGTEGGGPAAGGRAALAARERREEGARV